MEQQGRLLLALLKCGVSSGMSRALSLPHRVMMAKCGCGSLIRLVENGLNAPRWYTAAERSLTVRHRWTAREATWGARNSLLLRACCVHLHKTSKN